MKKLWFYLSLMALMICVAACSAILGDSKPSTTNDSVFEICIYTDKEEYTTDDAIGCYATVEYVGAADSITIYSGDPLVHFYIQGGVFNGDYAVNDVLKTTTFKRNEPVRFDFAKSGGYSADDKNAVFWKSWYADPEFKLPAGEYNITAEIEGSFDADNAGQPYTIAATATVTVK